MLAPSPSLRRALWGAILLLAFAAWWGRPGEVAARPGVLVPQFVDVTAASGITFRHTSGREDEKRYIFEAKGGGIGALDYDNDGWIDLYVVQGSTLERWHRGENPHGVLLRNRGDWTF